jgi:hypothetical protein
MTMSFCIMRARTRMAWPEIQVLTYWNGSKWVSGKDGEEAKRYVRRSSAEKVLGKLLKRCQAFNDECSIVEFD